MKPIDEVKKLTNIQIYCLLEENGVPVKRLGLWSANKDELLRVYAEHILNKKLTNQPV